MRLMRTTRRTAGGVLVILGEVCSLGACERARTPEKAVAAAETPPDPDTGVVLARGDWKTFEQHLSRDPAIAASDLERYRRAHGLPFDFFLAASAPAALKRALDKNRQDDAMCGQGLTVFVRRFPQEHSAFIPSPVIEFDSAGTILRRWPMPNDAEYSEVVAGIEGDELVASYLRRSGVFMRVKPTGEYRISSEPPLPLPPEEWLSLPDSTWVRVRPRDEGTFSMHSPFTRGVEPGSWVPHGDSGWYERVDSGPNRGMLLQAVKGSRTTEPRMISCPASKEFEGLVCRGYPDAGRERRIARPSICT